jgi:hypothetical protein
MKRSTSFAQSFFALITLLTFSIAASATVPTNIEPPGGTRGLIQLRSDVEITQPTPEYLEITVVDEDGVVVTTITTYDAKTTFSTDGWDSGEYTVQTIDDDADYQEHMIYVD